MKIKTPEQLCEVLSEGMVGVAKGKKPRGYVSDAAKMADVFLRCWSQNDKDRRTAVTGARLNKQLRRSIGAAFPRVKVI